MTAAFGSAAVTAYGTGTLAVTGGKPTGLQVGELMTASLFSNNALGSYTPPALVGATTVWTQCSGSPDTTIGSATFEKIADAADVAATDFPFVRGGSSSSSCDVVVIRWTDAKNVAAVKLSTAAAGTTITLSQVTAASASTLLGHVVVKPTATAGAFAAPPGSAVSRGAGTTASPTTTYAIADEVVAAGATGSRVWTYAGTSVARGVLIAINPADRPRNIRSSNPALSRSFTW